MAEEKRLPKRCIGFVVLMIAIEIAAAGIWTLQYLQTGIVTSDIFLIAAMAVATIGLVLLSRAAQSGIEEKRMAKWAIGIYVLMIAVGTILVCSWALQYLQTGVAFPIGTVWVLPLSLFLIILPLPFLRNATRRLAQSSKSSR